MSKVATKETIGQSVEKKFSHAIWEDIDDCPIIQSTVKEVDKLYYNIYEYKYSYVHPYTHTILLCTYVFRKVIPQKKSVKTINKTTNPSECKKKITKRTMIIEVYYRNQRRI